MTLAIDATTPVWANSTATVTTLTSASFSPPANALLAVLWANGQNSVGLSSITDSISAVTWGVAAKASSLNSTHEGAEVWLGQVGASAPGALTVTSHFASNGSQAMGVVVITGAAPMTAQTGQTQAVNNAAGTGLPSATISALSGSNSLVLAAIANGSNVTLPTIPAGQSDVFNGNTYAAAQTSAAGWAQYLTGINLAAGSSATINDTAPTINYSLAMLEILVATPAVPVVTRFLPRNTIGRGLRNLGQMTQFVERQQVPAVAAAPVLGIPDLIMGPMSTG